MKNVSIFEQAVKVRDGSQNGKFAILRADPGVSNPKPLMDAAVDHYVGKIAYNEFIEIYLDNPWVRVIVKDINSLDFIPFEGQTL